MSKSKQIDVNSDLRVIAALAAFGKPVFGEYVVTARVALTKADGRVKNGWESREGLLAGRVGWVREYSFRERDVDLLWSYEICLPSGYGNRSTALIVYCSRALGPQIMRCPTIREGTPDVDWVLALLTNFTPRPGAAGLLSRIDPSENSSTWHDVFLRLIDEGAISETMIRAALAAEHARYDAQEAAENAKEETARLHRVAEREATR